MMLIVVKLLKLDIENFRGIKNFVLTPDGRSVTVQGANGTGKSTLMAAFLWLLTGKDARTTMCFRWEQTGTACPAAVLR